MTRGDSGNPTLDHRGSEPALKLMVDSHAVDNRSGGLKLSSIGFDGPPRPHHPPCLGYSIAAAPATGGCVAVQARLRGPPPAASRVAPAWLRAPNAHRDRKSSVRA